MLNKGAIISGLAAALLGSGLLWYAGAEQNKGIAGWETLNASMEQVLEVNKENGLILLSTEEPYAKGVSATPGTSATSVTPETPMTGYVPAVSESPTAAPTTLPAIEGMVNVNTADAAGLMNLPGIGAKKAQAIIDYRNSHGPFRTHSDLVKVKGIGPKILEKLKPMVQF